MALSQKESLILTVAVLSSLLSVEKELRPGEKIPKSSIYLGLDCDLFSYEFIMGLCVKAGWIVVTSDTIALTESGREKARRLDEIVEKKIDEGRKDEKDNKEKREWRQKVTDAWRREEDKEKRGLTAYPRLCLMVDDHEKISPNARKELIRALERLGVL